MFLGWVELIAGLILLVLGGDFLVNSAIRIATYLRVSPMVVGLTIVSFGTSFPELVVSVNAAVSGHADISIGNVVGSNIANLALVLGITAALKTLYLTRANLIFDWPLMLFATGALIAMSLDGELGFYEGIAFVTGLFVYNFIILKQGKKEDDPDYSSHSKPMLSNVLRSLLILVISLVALLFGAEILIDGAVTIAQGLGIGERVIAVSIIAFGTSTPELATSIMAIRKKEAGLSLGNLIGSNVFNILGILGVTSLVAPIAIAEETLKFDYLWVLGIPLLMYPFMLFGQRVGKLMGILLIATYFAYLWLIF